MYALHDRSCKAIFSQRIDYRHFLRIGKSEAAFSLAFFCYVLYAYFTYNSMKMIIF